MSSKSKSVPSPFDITTHNTEWTCAATMKEWINNIIAEKELDLGHAEVETKKKGTSKRADIIIPESQRSNKVLCVIECKQPYWDVFNIELKDDARNKANSVRAKYFCTTNFKKLIWWKTTEANNATISEEFQIVDKYELSEIENIDDFEETRYSKQIKAGLERFLLTLYSVNTGNETEPKLAIDELLIFRLHEKIRVLAKYYKTIIYDKTHKDSKFREKLTLWFLEQNWSFSLSENDFDKAARQTAYLLVNKILFYDMLQAKRVEKLSPLAIPDGLIKGSQLQTILQSYFDEVLKIDYQTIYTADFIDTIAFPDSKDVIREIEDLIKVLRRYDIAGIGFEIIGRIFEKLIPSAERHYLGQYYTNSDVVDLILRFTLRHETDKILDPSCGAGTFLVRAYQHKKLMNQRLTHFELIEELWGNDIAKFPAHLATINLAINDLSIDRNYPNIIKEDFFALKTRDDGFDLPVSYRKRRAISLGQKERDVEYPRWFDVIVGNPPYTRQEEIEDIGVDKEELIESALKVGTKKVAEISRRAGIHAYFFIHGTKFLKNNGRFGFIVSNSWLDVDYGKGLQEFFLNNYKIITIIESKVERWFDEADINTCIVVLEKCKDKSERVNNTARFVYLKKPLKDLMHPAQDIWEKQIERLNDIDNLIKTILGHSKYYENDEMRIYPITQKELWHEGYDNEEKKFIGAKWGKYLRAPQIFFKILEKAKDKLVPLKEVAKVRFGIKTGANDFFYLTEKEIKEKKIEKEFWCHKNKKGEWVPNYVIKSPRECKSIIANSDTFKFRILMIHKNKNKLKGTNVLKYINEGERNAYNERPTCASRLPSKNWYDLGTNINDIIAFPERVRLRYIFFYNNEKVSLNKNLYGVSPFHSNLSKEVCLTLNCTLTALFTELFARQPGGGGGPLDIDVIVAKDILIPSVKFIEQHKKYISKVGILEREIDTIFNEIGATKQLEVSLSKIKPDRRELDKIVMGDMLGLTEDEQLEVYKAVIDLVSSRINKANTVQGRKKQKERIDIELLNRQIWERINEKQ